MLSLITSGLLSPRQCRGGALSDTGPSVCLSVCPMPFSIQTVHFMANVH